MHQGLLYGKNTLVAKVTFKYTMDGCHALMHALLIFFLDFFSLIFLG